MGILRSHKNEVTNEGKVVSGMESLALVAKGKNLLEEDVESDLSDCELSKEEYNLMVLKLKSFAKKCFGCIKNRN